MSDVRVPVMGGPLDGLTLPIPAGELDRLAIAGVELGVHFDAEQRVTVDLRASVRGEPVTLSASLPAGVELGDGAWAVLLGELFSRLEEASVMAHDCGYDRPLRWHELRAQDRLALGMLAPLVIEGLDEDVIA